MTAGVLPLASATAVHYKLGVRTRQHVKGRLWDSSESPNSVDFALGAVTLGLTLSQEYRQTGLYSFVMRLLQICANVKRAPGAVSQARSSREVSWRST